MSRSRRPCRRPPRAARSLVGPGTPPRDATLDDVVAAVRRSRLAADPTLDDDPRRRASATPADRACRTGSRCDRAASGGARRGRATGDAAAVRGVLASATPARRWSRTAAGRASSAASTSVRGRRPSSRSTFDRLAGLHGARRAQRPRDVRGRHDRPGGRGRPRAARPDARALPAVVRGVDGRWLGRHALGRPAVARLSVASRSSSPAATSRRRADRSTSRRTRRRRPAPTCARSSSARRDAPGS